MGIYFHTQLGGLDGSILKYLNKYNISAYFDHNSDLEKCILTFFLLNNKIRSNCDKTLIKACVQILKENGNSMPIITLMHENDIDMLTYCCKDLGLVSFSLDQIESLLRTENRFFTKFEDKEKQYVRDVEKSYLFKELYIEEVSNIFNKWMKCR